MAFNGTKHFPKNEIISFMESLGMRFGADVNAYTSFDETVYMLTVPTDKPEMMDRALLILEDWAHNLSFDPPEVEKERGVVMEEWRVARSKTPTRRVGRRTDHSPGDRRVSVAPIVARPSIVCSRACCRRVFRNLRKSPIRRLRWPSADAVVLSDARRTPLPSLHW